MFSEKADIDKNFGCSARTREIIPKIAPIDSTDKSIMMATPKAP